MPQSETEYRMQAALPAGLLIDDDNSIWAVLRGVVGEWLEDRRQDLEQLWLEMNINTASLYLGAWEEQMGLPPNVSTDIIKRRASVKARFKKGPFTRTRRKEIVEDYLLATLGPAVELTPDGVPLTAGGVPLYSGASSVTSLYSIVENIPAFSYTVHIDPSAAIDFAALTRDLARITPSGYSFTVVSP